MLIKYEPIIGVKEDLLWIVLIPPIAFVFYLVFLILGKTGLLAPIVLVLFSYGHSVAGVLRTIEEKSLVDRYPLRIFLLPVFFALTVWIFTRAELTCLLLLLLFWRTYHYMMQLYGISRIYERQLETYRNCPKWIDLGFYASWFLAFYASKLLENCEASRPSLQNTILMIQSMLIKVQPFFYVLASSFTVIFFGNVLLRLRNGREVPFLKLAMACVAVPSYGYASQLLNVDNLMYLSVSELMHTIPYLAILWKTNIKSAGNSTRRLLFFFSAVLLTGILWRWGLKAPAKEIVHFAASFGLVAALLHFYFDGFIWKMRESKKGFGDFALQATLLGLLLLALFIGETKYGLRLRRFG